MRHYAMHPHDQPASNVPPTTEEAPGGAWIMERSGQIAAISAAMPARPGLLYEWYLRMMKRARNWRRADA